MKVAGGYCSQGPPVDLAGNPIPLEHMVSGYNQVDCTPDTPVNGLCEAGGGGGARRNTGHGGDGQTILQATSGKTYSDSCGTTSLANNCFGGFDIYQHVQCDTPPWPYPPLPPPPASPSWVAYEAPKIYVPIASIFGVVAFLLTVYCAKKRRARRAEARTAAARKVVQEHDAMVIFAVRSLPTKQYLVDVGAPSGVELGSMTPGGTMEETECAICMTAIRAGEELRVLPCGHTFKMACIDEWLLGKGRAPPKGTSIVRGLGACPLCKVCPITVPEPTWPPKQGASPRVLPADRGSGTA